MTFGMGLFEIVLVLVVLGLFGAAIGVVVKLVGHAAGTAAGRVARGDEERRLAQELEAARLRIEELEARVERIDEKATFTQQLLERPRDGA